MHISADFHHLTRILPYPSLSKFHHSLVYSLKHSGMSPSLHSCVGSGFTHSYGESKLGFGFTRVFSRGNSCVGRGIRGIEGEKAGVEGEGGLKEGPKSNFCSIPEALDSLRVTGATSRKSVNPVNFLLRKNWTFFTLSAIFHAHSLTETAQQNRESET